MEFENDSRIRELNREIEKADEIISEICGRIDEMISENRISPAELAKLKAWIESQD